MLTLEAAVGRALERSHEIQAAQAARDASQAQAAGARAAWWPELDAIARGGIDQNTRDRDGNRQPGGEVWRSEAGVSARWTLASWGARAARELAGQAGLAATEEQVRVVVLRMASRVIALYLEILRLRDLTETAEFNFNETVRFRDRVAGAVSGGERLSVAAEIDVRVAQRRQSLLERLESLQRAESQLTLLIGGPVGDLIEPEPTTPAVATLDQLVELARRESRLVAAAEARAAAAAAAYDAARAERWGTLGLDLEATAGRNVGGAEGRATSVTGLLVARLPLAGGARSALAAEAAGRSQQAREELAQTIRDVAAGTRDAYDVYAYAAQRREAAEAEYTAQAAKLALFEAEFARGAVQRQLTDVLEQIEASANARSRVASMRYAELLAIYALLRESGLLHETLGTRELADRLVRRLRSDPPLLMLLAGLTAPPAAQAGGASPSGAAPSGGSGAVP